MITDPRLEKYLSSLERALKPLPVSDRAEIITEIKSHALSALERDPQISLDTVLAALGEPETVANRYLIERGVQPTKPPISPVVKWLVIGFLGTLSLILATFIVVVLQFSPLLHVDEKSDEVSLLGGLLRIDGKDHSMRLQGSLRAKWDEDLQTFIGSALVSPKEDLTVVFSNGHFSFENSNDSQFYWKCRSKPSLDPVINPSTTQNGLNFDLSGLEGVKCELSIPKKIHLLVQGSNGKIDFQEPRYQMTTTLTNGKVTIAPESDRAYRFNLSVKNGHADSFQSSQDPEAHEISVAVVNGQIQKER